MYCPECGAEYREGYDQCGDCGVSLATDPPGGDAGTGADWVIVHETSETDVLPVLKSLLRSAEIPFSTRGEDLLNLFPSEALGPLYTRHAGEVQLVVPPDRADEARELLNADFEAPPEPGGDED